MKSMYHSPFDWLLDRWSLLQDDSPGVPQGEPSPDRGRHDEEHWDLIDPPPEESDTF